ncbi:PASTA domain-containing protein [Flavobacterium aurantiibacter]|uniref:PASTA domain-containing protein n=1 Tax=Flavobacterium aurantiibacter TaxID=2023067 RepID=A0A255ZPH5_9FLAO|nr:PASTA domain-containing protein [Flavobacterium aurantiibacter]OYQ42785.1 PASTA domain-containing protein [Flavobacterium aurantiibacter]
MTLREYLTSKTFFGQLFLAFIITIAVGFLLLQYLDFSTNHGEEIAVPNLAKMSTEQAEEVLDDADLDYVVLDTVDFNPEFPKFSVVQQDPAPGEKVKSDRKIYLKINSGGYSTIRMPELVEKTLRNAESTLQSAGLTLGSLTYKPYIGKDMVLEVKCNGKTVKAGEKILKGSKIDLVLGDGSGGFEDEEDTQEPIDSLP